MERDVGARGRWEAASVAQEQLQYKADKVNALAALRAETSDRVPPAALLAGGGMLLAELAGSVPGMAFTARRLVPFRRAARWEALADAVQSAGGSVFLVKLGPAKDHAARAGFARDLFSAGGFDVQESEPLADIDAAVGAFAESGSQLACICGLDGDYERLAPTLATRLGSTGARMVVVAGRFPADPDRWRASGIDDVVHLGGNVLGVLTRMAGVLGVQPLADEESP